MKFIDYWRIAKTVMRFLSPKFRREIRALSIEICSSDIVPYFELQLKKGRPKQRSFFMLVGFTHVGKSTLIKEHEVLSILPQIKTNAIHEKLNGWFSFLRDDNTVNGRGYWPRQYLTKIVRQNIFNYGLTPYDVSLVSDSCNLARANRLKILALAKKNGYRTIIIYVKCPEDELLQRLKKADEISGDNQTTWQDLYHQVQLPRFDITGLEEEADVFYNFESGTDDPKDLHIDIMN